MRDFSTETYQDRLKRWERIERAHPWMRLPFECRCTVDDLQYLLDDMFYWYNPSAWGPGEGVPGPMRHLFRNLAMRLVDDGLVSLDRDLSRLPVIGDPDEQSRAMAALRWAMLERRAVRFD